MAPGTSVELAPSRADDAPLRNAASPRYEAIECAEEPEEAGVYCSPARSEAFGYALMLLSACFFEAAAMFSRALTTPQKFSRYAVISPANMVFLRGVSQIVLVAAVSLALRVREVLSVPRELLPLLAARGVFGAASLSLTYTALSLAPLGIVTSIFFLNPIFTILLSAATLGERVTAREGVAALMSIAGCVLVANPKLERPAALDRAYVLGCCIVLLSAGVVSVAFVSVRALGRRVHFLSTVLSFACATAAVGAAMGGARLPPRAPVALALTGCLFGFLGQCCLNLGFQYCRASTGALLRNIDVPLAYALGLLFLGEVPHMVSLLGSALVVAGTVVVGLGAVKK